VALERRAARGEVGPRVLAVLQVPAAVGGPALVERRLGLVGDDRRGLDIEEDDERVRDERDNFQAALGWAWRTGEDELALRLGSACIRFWGRSGRHLRRGHGDPGLFRDAKAWLVQQAIQHAPGESPERAAALQGERHRASRYGQSASMRPGREDGRNSVHGFL